MAVHGTDPDVSGRADRDRARRFAERSAGAALSATGAVAPLVWRALPAERLAGAAPQFAGDRRGLEPAGRGRGPAAGAACLVARRMAVARALHPWRRALHAAAGDLGGRVPGLLDLGGHV